MNTAPHPPRRRTLSIARVLTLILALTLAASAPASDDGAASEAAFARLSALVGVWRGTLPDGRTHTLTYSLIARESVVVEHWAFASGRTSMTLYHRAGDGLIATHYCPQGNQPRLRFVPGTDPAVLAFEFLDGLNVDVPGASHQRFLQLVMTGDDVFERSETYVPNEASAEEIAAATPGEATVFVRLGAATPAPTPTPAPAPSSSPSTAASPAAASSHEPVAETTPAPALQVVAAPTPAPTVMPTVAPTPFPGPPRPLEIAR